MRRTPFTVSILLLSGVLLVQTAGRLHADFVTSKTTPNTFNPMNQADVKKWNDLYSAGKISFAEYQAALLKIEKSMNTVSGSDVISVGTRSNSNNGSAIPVEHVNPPVPAGQPTIGSTQITARWGDNGNLEGSPSMPVGTLYVVQISSDPGFSTITESTTTPNALSYTFTGLSPDTQYFMRVKAVDPNSGTPSPFTVLPEATTLSAFAGGPTSVTAVDRGNYQGNHYWELYWTLPPGFTCPFPAAPPVGIQDFVYLAHTSDSTAQQSYAGPSGYSLFTCQVNVYDRAGSGPTQLWFDYAQSFNGQTIPVALPAASMELLF